MKHQFPIAIVPWFSEGISSHDKIRLFWFNKQVWESQFEIKIKRLYLGHCLMWTPLAIVYVTWEKLV